jgi:adenylate cyclase
MDFAAAGLLDGLEGEERADRERLLARLAAEGCTIAELKAAIAEHRLALLPVDRVLGGTYTAREVEQRTGLPTALLMRIRRLGGLPEAAPTDRVFGDEDIEMAQSTSLFLQAGFSEDAIVEITRVLGEGMARLAATTAAAFLEAFLEPGEREPEVALRFAALAEQLIPALSPVLTASYKAHLRESVRRGVLGRAELAAGGIVDAPEITVCFADLVGFTRLGGEVEVQELGTVAGRLADLATEASTPPVRLIKTIGDAAMLVSPVSGPLVAAALSLVDAVQRAGMPALRAGIASGPALLRAGDFIGHSVNLASRVTGVARPDSVLCTEAVMEADPDGFDWSFAGRFRLRGVPEPCALYRARELGTSDPTTRAASRPARRPRADRPRRPASR